MGRKEVEAKAFDMLVKLRYPSPEQCTPIREISKALQTPFARAFRLYATRCRRIYAHEYLRLLELTEDKKMKKSSGCRDVELREMCDVCDAYMDDNHCNEFKPTEMSRLKNVFVCSKCADEIEMDVNQFWKRVL